MDRFYRGELIKERRLALQLTAVEMARRLGITRQHYHRIEAGKVNSLPRVNAACHELGLDLEEIFQKKNSDIFLRV